ncbi:MAG: PepSY-associated TM helix domain-containing protein [Dysgonomonas sp.]|nr:PepSY-associated TM helix domain-containing protein [Dysgonomonas sp.]
MTLRKLIKKIHIWLSIPVGLIISIICITGALLTFETEILEVCYPERYFVEEVKGEKMPLDKLIPLVNAQLQDNNVASIKITDDPRRTYTATLEEGFRVTAFVDPYTGELKGTRQFREGFFYHAMTLHRWLMDGTRTWGKYTVGITTLLFVFIIISGIVWWVPSDRKRIKNRLQVKTKNGLKRFLFDIHTALGIYAAIFLLICCLTGMMWSFEWYRNVVNSLFGVENTAQQRGGGHGGRGDKKDKPKQINTQNWQVAYNNLNEKNRGNKFITIADGSATVLTKEAPHLRATDRYMFDSKTGEIGKATIFSEQKSSSKIMSWAYALHVGAYGGLITRILTCIACIIGTTLPLTGYYIFYKKNFKKPKKKKTSLV